MIPIKDLLDKLKWDKRFNPEEYTLYYHDRVKDELISVDYTKIKRIEGSFMIIERDCEEVSIPLHRIHKVMKGKMNVWRRNTENASKKSVI